MMKKMTSIMFAIIRQKTKLAEWILFCQNFWVSIHHESRMNCCVDPFLNKMCSKAKVWEFRTTFCPLFTPRLDRNLSLIHTSQNLLIIVCIQKISSSSRSRSIAVHKMCIELAFQYPLLIHSISICMKQDSDISLIS